jgi:pyruvate formate lyase activating enzyme
MKIKNVEKSSTVDYPPHISAVVFLSGCNFRCPFCYNKELVDNNSTLPDIPKDEFLQWLTTRQGKLDSVVLTGGEPTIHGQELLDFAREIKELGFKVKLDTNGSNPELLKSMIEQKLVDYVAVDLKADRMRYKQACGVDFDMSKMDKTIKTLSENIIPYEFRTTVIPGIHNDTVLRTMALYVKSSPKYALQQFKPFNTLDPSYEKIVPFSEADMEKFKKDFEYLTTAMEIEFRR